MFCTQGKLIPLPLRTMPWLFQGTLGSVYLHSSMHAIFVPTCAPRPSIQMLTASCLQNFFNRNILCVRKCITGWRLIEKDYGVYMSTLATWTIWYHAQWRRTCWVAGRRRQA